MQLAVNALSGEIQNYYAARGYGKTAVTSRIFRREVSADIERVRNKERKKEIVYI